MLVTVDRSAFGISGVSSDPGHLEVFFQGVHRADAHGRLSGAEALVRWRHPTLGLLSPDKFIPIAEEAGMIDQLGGWVLRNAAKAAASWPTDMSVAVNVSPSQIRHRDFDRYVRVFVENNRTGNHCCSHVFVSLTVLIRSVLLQC